MPSCEPTKVCHWHFILHTAHGGDDPDTYEMIPYSYWTDGHPDCESCRAERLQ